MTAVGADAAGAAAPSLARLREMLASQGGLIARLLPAQPTAAERAGGEGGPAQLAVRGPRVATRAAAEYELLIEAIYEGYLLHYGAPRLLAPAEADLGLLAGDHLYALGLARLVALGDLPAVGELADVITLTALAHGSGDGALAEAVWWAGAQAVGWGPSEGHARAKALVREGAARATGALRALLAEAPG